MKNIREVIRQVASRMVVGETPRQGCCGAFYPYPVESGWVPQGLRKVMVNVLDLDISFFDKNQAYYLDAFWDLSGSNVGGGGGGPYDLTSAIDRAIILTSIEQSINTVYSTSTVSSSCTLVGDKLTINVVCSGIINLPMQAISIALYSSGSSPFPIPISFG